MLHLHNPVFHRAESPVNMEDATLTLLFCKTSADKQISRIDTDLFRQKITFLDFISLFYLFRFSFRYKKF